MRTATLSQVHLQARTTPRTGVDIHAFKATLAALSKQCHITVATAESGKDERGKDKFGFGRSTFHRARVGENGLLRPVQGRRFPKSTLLYVERIDVCLAALSGTEACECMRPLGPEGAFHRFQPPGGQRDLLGTSVELGYQFPSFEKKTRHG